MLDCLVLLIDISAGTRVVDYNESTSFFSKLNSLSNLKFNYYFLRLLSIDA